VLKAWWRLRRALSEATPLLQAGDYWLEEGAARRLVTDSDNWRLHPRRFRITGPPSSGPGYDTVIRRSGCLILLGEGRDHVLRLYRDQGEVDRLMTNSRWLRPAFPCPAAETVPVELPGWFGVREDFVSGRILRDAASNRWVPIYRKFLGCCAVNATRCEGRLETKGWFNELDSWSSPPQVHQLLSFWHDELVEILDGAPLLRSHGDAHNGNLIVTEEGDLVVIDVERVEAQPFFFDALSILRGSEEVNQHLRRRYLSGLFDNELMAVWQAAGERFWPELRIPYLLAVAVCHAFRPQFADGPAHRRQEKLVKAVQKVQADCESGRPSC